MSILIFFGISFFVVLVSSIYVGYSMRHLWQQYQLKKQLMKKQNIGVAVHAQENISIPSN